MRDLQLEGFPAEEDRLAVSVLRVHQTSRCIRHSTRHSREGRTVHQEPHKPEQQSHGAAHLQGLQ
eukprot:6149474-Pleurochrysis_carterae.AAC.2